MTADHIALSDNPYRKPVKKWLVDRYGEQDAASIWEDVARNYGSYLAEAPEYGGKKNGHARAIYGALLVFALYAALPDSPPVSELRDFVQTRSWDRSLPWGRSSTSTARPACGS